MSMTSQEILDLLDQTDDAHLRRKLTEVCAKDLDCTAQEATSRGSRSAGPPHLGRSQAAQVDPDEASEAPVPAPEDLGDSVPASA